MAAPQHETASTLAGAFRATSTTISVPASVAAGDIIEIFVYREDIADTVGATGFTLKSTATADNHRLHVLWKRATGSDAGTYTITCGGTSEWVEAAARRTSGAVASGDPYDQVNTNNANVNATTAPTVQVTTTVADVLLSYASTNVTGGAWTPPSGMTERTDIGEDLTTATVAQAVAGASGTKSATCAGSGHRAAFLGALKPASTSTSAPAESASLTVTANNATTTVTATAESASVTVSAFDATVSTSNNVSATAESASVTVAANSATVTAGATAGAPSLTVTANDAATTVKPAAESASITVTAYNATISNDPAAPDVDPETPWVIRIAPGGDISEDPQTLDWEDITSRIRPGVQLRIGRERPGEHANACQLAVRANNDDGALTPELVTAAWWPYIDLGLPMQLWRANSGGTAVLRATVAVDSITTEWANGLDDKCDVVIVASGYLRWMGQGQEVAATASVTSTVAASPLGAWPLTDVAGATTGASSLPAGTPMTRTTTGVAFGQVTGPDGVTKYPSIAASGRLVGAVPTTTVTDRWSVQLDALAESSVTDWWTVASWSTTSTSAPSWRLRWDGPTGGSTTLRYVDGDDTEHTVITAAGNPLGAWHRVAAYCIQSGGNVSCSLYIDGVLAGTGTATSATTGRITQVFAGDYDGVGNGMVSVGDVSVWDSEVNAAGSFTSQTGYDGEMAHVRFARLCDEAGIPASTDATVSTRMGPQKAQTLVDALRACEDTDSAIITDRTDRGLRFVSVAEMYNQTAALTLDATAPSRHLQFGFSAARDDSTAATDVTITRDGGSSRRRVVESRRVYTDSATLSLYTDDLAGAHASWRAHHGAQTDLRITSLTWDAAKVPSLLDATLALRVGQRIVVTGLPRPYPYDEVSLIVQGWTEVHDLDTFRMTALVYPARLYEIMTIGDNNPANWGDTTARVDSDTSTIGGAGGTTSSTSLVVVSGYGWSRTAVPYDLDLLGEQVRVTAMGAYSGGQQTATVTRAINGISKAIPVGTPVRLWRPPVIGL